MEPPSLSVKKDIRFLLSLLRITHPGQPVSRQTKSLEELLVSKTNG